MKKVLIVDDSAYMRSLIQNALKQSGRYEILAEVANGTDAVEMCLELQPDIITLDNILPDMLGVDVIRELRRENVTSKILMVSAVGQDQIIEECTAVGANSYLVKPFTPEVLLKRIDSFFIEENA